MHVKKGVKEGYMLHTNGIFIDDSLCFSFRGRRHCRVIDARGGKEPTKKRNFGGRRLQLLKIYKSPGLMYVLRLIECYVTDKS